MNDRRRRTRHRRSAAMVAHSVAMLSATVIALTWSVTTMAQDRNPAVAIDVVVCGVSGALRANVLAHLDIWQQREGADLKATHIARLHRLAPKQIEAALRPFGFYHPAITADLARDGNHWRARYAIDPGQPVRIANLDIRLQGAGADDQRLGRIATASTLRVDAPLDQREYDALKARLVDAAIAQGYLDARYSTHRIALDRDANRAAISLHLDTGPLYRAGPVHFEQSGPVQLDPQLLRRFATFAPAAPLSSQLTLDLHTALANSGLFQAVEVMPERERAQGDRVPLRVAVRTDSRSRYRFGAGFGTDSGARGSLSHERLVNTRGHRLGLNAALAQRSDMLDARYTIPLRDPVNETLVFSAGASRDDTDSRTSRNLRAGVAHTRLLGAWRQSLGIGAEYEDYEVGGVDATSKLLFPNASWSRSASDHPLFPRHGWYLGISLLGAARGVGSDVTFVQGRIDGKWLATYARQNRVIARGALGAIGTSSFTDLPPSKRFFAGGDNSVRGYDFEALGTTDSDGDVVGGRYLVVGSLEYERLLTKQWGAAVFYDVGNAFSGADESPGRAIGIGARWRTPIGLIRLDVARPLTDGDGNYRIHLVIGPEL